MSLVVLTWKAAICYSLQLIILDTFLNIYTFRRCYQNIFYVYWIVTITYQKWKLENYFHVLYLSFKRLMLNKLIQMAGMNGNSKDFPLLYFWVYRKTRFVFRTTPKARGKIMFQPFATSTKRLRYCTILHWPMVIQEEVFGSTTWCMFFCLYQILLLWMEYYQFSLGSFAPKPSNFHVFLTLD